MSIYIKRPSICAEEWGITKYGRAFNRLRECRLNRAIVHTKSRNSVFPPQVARDSLRAAVDMSRHWEDCVTYMEKTGLDPKHLIPLEVTIWTIVDEKSKQKEMQKV